MGVMRHYTDDVIADVLNAGKPQKENPQAVQLAQWRVYSYRWVLQPEMRTTTPDHSLGEGISQLHLVCAGLRYHNTDTKPLGPCGQSIWCVYDGSTFLAVDVETLDAAIVAHIRNVHREMEDLVYSSG